jgi:H+-transporting ATPase
VAQKLGIAVKMVTGDHVAIASQIAGQLGLGTHILPANDLLSGDAVKGELAPNIAETIETADGFAQVFPEQMLDVGGGGGRLRTGLRCGK